MGSSFSYARVRSRFAYFGSKMSSPIRSSAQSTKVDRRGPRVTSVSAISHDDEDASLARERSRRAEMETIRLSAHEQHAQLRNPTLAVERLLFLLSESLESQAPRRLDGLHDVAG